MRPVLVSFVVLMSMLAGCASPRASFYRLSADPSLTAISTATATRATTRPVIVGPVTVPDLVDRPQIVTRNTDNEVALNEYARWGEPLKSSIADAIAADLAVLLASGKVAPASRAIADPDAWRVRVDIQQFESVPGDAVMIDAQWTVRRFGDESALTGRSMVREPVNGDGWDALVAAHSRALARVSREIAGAIAGSAVR
ncbi:lipoprotein [Caballeronia fortuita]|uniref:Lipoprotein n=1 Tax=Caballeronia fortuita TaxID=1777138 RepID=A0A157ZWH9_9BURK|nr:PqiC family protein [Caballeronia fortuita]SAK49871.1 lipoprotein [Caballeronia fortuita]